MRKKGGHEQRRRQREEEEKRWKGRHAKREKIEKQDYINGRE